ncbi:HDL143Wp [Eremothecium sinecaudum]|uniref:HDL143Wp n=1 Tax=Eremothecium sinecaudum TaxID=45286 RepID=A0A0X8HSE8_9SACH|nr:HDL143Wp [Eremothecium sinecaudum]AMD20601.1 HDL143Wp [Eremothecium sinecaudum]
MTFPQTAEGITKYLRSKTISTTEVCQIAQKIEAGECEFYFPNAHVFIIELIIDRWNDAKNVDFKEDWNIWKLFNTLWLRIQDEDHQKKLLKGLRYISNLLQTIQLIKGSYDDFARVLLEQFRLINRTTAVQCSPEDSIKVIGGVLNLVLYCEKPHLHLRESIISEAIILVDIENVTKSTSKLILAYLKHLLSPTMSYFYRFDFDSVDSYNVRLLNMLGKFLFNDNPNILANLKTFIEEGKLELETATTLFKSTIYFLSGTDFKKLEDLFTMIVEISPESASKMLSALSHSKKTLSQEFLENLFNVTIPQEDLKLLSNIINLDIDVGIKNTNRLLKILSNAEPSNITIELWSKLVKCYVAARELPKFIDTLKEYANQTECDLLLKDVRFFGVVVQSVPLLSVTQLKLLLNDLVDEIIRTKTAPTILVTSIVVRGLKDISSSTLSELRLILAKIFEIQYIEVLEFWDLRYHVLEVYEDLLTEDSASSFDIKQLLGTVKKPPVTFFLNIFKLRELVEFKMEEVICSFMACLAELSSAEDVLLELFQRWSSIVELTFSKEDIENLILISLKDDNISIFDEIFKDDDFFEENRIMQILVTHLAGMINNESCLNLLIQIPIQCINKHIRVETINKTMEKPQLLEQDLRLLKHLLLNPTFKSYLESDPDQLMKVVSQPSAIYFTKNDVFEIVWLNNVNNIRAPECKSYIMHTISTLLSQIKQQFSFPVYKLSYYVVQSTPDTISECNELRKQYISGVTAYLESLTNFDKNAELVSWLLKSLYYISESGKEAEKVPDNLIEKLSLGLRRTRNPLLLESFFMLLTTRNTEKLKYLLAHYLVLRSYNVEKTNLRLSIESLVKRVLLLDENSFNDSFELIIASFAECSTENIIWLVELYEIFTAFLSKSNTKGTFLFTKSISEFHTNSNLYIGNREAIVTVINIYKNYLSTKPWLFPQYAIELLFPMCIKLNVSMSARNQENWDDCYILTTQLLSSVLIYHRYKLSSRHHLMNTSICSLLEIISSDTNLTANSARSLARLITNLCEPSNVSDFAKDSLNSKITFIKRSLRRFLPVILLKFINLSVSKPFSMSIRNELTISIYSIFDVLSPTEFAIVNANIDSADRAYLKALYDDYRKVGKWRDD